MNNSQRRALILKAELWAHNINQNSECFSSLTFLKSCCRGTESSSCRVPELLIHSRVSNNNWLPLQPQPPLPERFCHDPLQSSRTAETRALMGWWKAQPGWCLTLVRRGTSAPQELFVAGECAENQTRSCCWSKVTAFYPGDELFLSFPFSLKYQFAFIKKLLPSSPEKKKKIKREQPPWSKERDWFI